MAEVIECPDCRRKLSMREEFLGTQVKCPSCGATFIASTELRPKPAPVTPAPERQDRDSERRRDYDEEARPRTRRDFDDDDRPRRRIDRYDDDDDRPRRRRRDPYDDDYDRLRPDRGGTVLTLGIIGLVFSCIPIVGWALGGIALGMGISDLGAMSRGRMDRTGESSTQGGKICGLIAVILSTLFVFIYCMAGEPFNRFWVD